MSVYRRWPPNPCYSPSDRIWNRWTLAAKEKKWRIVLMHSHGKPARGSLTTTLSTPTHRIQCRKNNIAFNKEVMSKGEFLLFNKTFAQQKLYSFRTETMGKLNYPTYRLGTTNQL